MTGDLMGHARYGLDLEDSLRLGAKCDSRFERVLDAMVAEKLEEIGRVLVHDDIAIWDVNSESIWQKFFFFLHQVSKVLTIVS
jgi:hypothetical protein